MTARAHAGALIVPPRPVSDLRDVIRTQACRAYWVGDDIQPLGSQGTPARLKRYAGGVETGGGDIILADNLNRFLPIRVLISTGGGLGTSKFNLSYNGVLAFYMVDVPTAASVNLRCLGEGTRLTFSNVSYTLNDAFETGLEYWPDRSGNAHHIVRAAADYARAGRLRFGDFGGGGVSQRAAVTTVEASGGGVGDTGLWLPSVAMTMPAPGTTATYMTGIVKLATITGGSVERSICLGSASNKFRVWIRGDGQVTMDNGTARVWPSYTFPKFNRWVRFRAYFSNSANDFLQFGSDTTTFASCGNNSDTSFQLLTPPTIAVNTAGAQTIAEFSQWDGLPTTNEMKREDVYYLNKYGIAPLVA